MRSINSSLRRLAVRPGGIKDTGEISFFSITLVFIFLKEPSTILITNSLSESLTRPPVITSPCFVVITVV